MTRLRTALLALALLLVPALPSSAATRVTADRPGTVGPRVHLVYLVGKGQPDRRLDTDGTLARFASTLQSWTKRETGGRSWRLDTFRDRGRVVPDVSFVRGSLPYYDCRFASPTDTTCVEDVITARTGGPGTAPVDLVAQDLARAGLKDPQVRYLVLVQASASIICGQAEGPEDTDRDPASVGHVAAVFLGDEGCPNDAPGTGGQVDWALVHELLHNDGATPLGAPHTCGGTRGHVCTAGLGTASPFADDIDPERADVMFPAPGVRLDEAHLDRGHDDYFETVAGLRDLADSPWLIPAGGAAPRS